MFKASLQFTFCIVIIFRTYSFAEKLFLEDEKVVREKPEYKLFRKSIRDGEHPEVACLPHPEVVQVEPSVTDLRNIPQFVTVNRCKGACHLPLNTEICTPIKTRHILVEVTFADGSSQPRYVEEHLACECECKTTCLYKHHFPDEKTCRCICMEKCKVDENQDPMTCACAPQDGSRGENNRVLIN